MSLMSRVVAVAILPVLLLGWSPGQPPTASNPQDQAFDTFVIEGGTLIDGNGGAPVRDALIIIQGNSIKTVTRKGQVVYPAGARVLRADGKFIVPGLMDAHVHYGEWLPELFLAYGVTSIFEIGGGGEWALAQRDATARGKIPARDNSSRLEAWPERASLRSGA